MSKIFIIFLIFALPSPAPSPVYNRALFHVSLRTGEMAESNQKKQKIEQHLFLQISALSKK